MTRRVTRSQRVETHSSASQRPSAFPTTAGPSGIAGEASSTESASQNGRAVRASRSVTKPQGNRRQRQNTPSTSSQAITGDINRRGAIPPHTGRHPSRPSTLTAEIDRVLALRNAIGVPAHGSSLTILLVDNGWDVTAAAQAFRDHRRVEQSQATNSINQRRHANSRYPAISEARVDAIDELHGKIVDGAKQKVHHTIADIVALLYTFRWDVEEAAEAYNKLAGDLSEFKTAMRSLRGRPQNQKEQDRRLADFLTFTDVDNWSSALKFLKSHVWDVARALEAWHLAGGVLEEEGGENNGGFRVLRSPSKASDDMNGNSAMLSANAPTNTAELHHIAPQWASETSLASDEDDLEEQLDEEESNDEYHGYLINREILPARPACPDPTKLVTEAIFKGKYKYLLFNKLDKESGKSFRFNDSDHESDEDKIEFDWTDAGHVKQVNAWRSQQNRRAEGYDAAARRQPWLDVELDFIWLLHAEHLEEVVHNDPQYLENVGEDGLPLSVSTDRLHTWAVKLNAQFEGKTHIDGQKISDVPRPSRSAGSINTQRGRIPAVVQDFLVPKNVAHPRTARTKTAKGRGNLKDSFRSTENKKRSIEEDSSDGDDSKGQSSKRRRTAVNTNKDASNIKVEVSDSDEIHSD